MALTAIATLFLLTAAAAAVGIWFREPFFRIARAFVDTLGGPGVAVGFFLPDAFTVPLPNDAFSALGLAGGLSFWTVVAWGTLGSLAGGSTGWLVGRRLRRTRWLDRFLTGRGLHVQEFLQRHGPFAVALAAVTPLPYSIFCWASGAARMSFPVFFLVSQLRLVRVAGYLYLIELGLFSIGP